MSTEPEGHPYDRSTKWLIEHFPEAILEGLAGLKGIRSCRPIQAELVQPRLLPDGLFEVQFNDHNETEIVVLEVATYPLKTLDDQVLRNALMATLKYKKLPEIITLILSPRGNYEVVGTAELISGRETAAVRWRWKVIELWKLKATDLLTSGDLGVLPWLALTQIDGDPEPLFRDARERIEEQAPTDQAANMLAVSWVLAGLRYDDTEWLSKIFGGREAMLDSSVLRELRDEWTTEGRQEGALGTGRKLIVKILQNRFGIEGSALEESLAKVRDEATLDELAEFALHCPDLQSFRNRIHG